MNYVVLVRLSFYFLFDFFYNYLILYLKVTLMDLVPDDVARGLKEPKVWTIYQDVIDKAEDKNVGMSLTLC